MKKGKFYTLLSAAGLFLILVLQPVTAAEEEVKAESHPDMMGAGGTRGMRWELTEERIEDVMHFLREREPERAQKLEQLRSEEPEQFEKEIRKVIQYLRPHTVLQGELSEEKIEHIMQMLREREPERAEELESLRSENPEQFEKELREMMRQFIARRHREGAEQMEGRRHPEVQGRMMGGRGRMDRGDGEGRKGGMMGGGMSGMGGMGGRGYSGRGRMSMQERAEELLGWLDENFPEKAERLRGIRQEHPEHFEKAMRHFSRRYRRIIEASDENPELAEVLKEDMRLKEHRWKLIDKIKEAQEGEKKTLIAELRKAISRRFDLIIKRKQIAYEHLKEELENLKREVKEGEKDIENWIKTKDKRVEERVKEVLGKMQEFEWD